jgi:methionine-rich copper-binding protein CopC
MPALTRRLALILAASLGAAVSRAQSTNAAPPTPTVAPVEVSGAAAPRLVSSYPAEGATVAAGVTALTLKFDRPLSDKPSLLSLSPTSGASAPPCLAAPREIDDGKTLVVLCSTRPGKVYEIALGPGSGLVGAGDRPIQTADLHFTTDETILDNIPDALEAAGLPVDADPVMGWREVGGPDTNSPGASLPTNPTALPATKAGSHD